MLTLTTNEAFLYDGLPCIKIDNDRFALFSPYGLRVAIVKTLKDIEKLKVRLKQFEFYSSSVPDSPMHQDHLDITVISTKSCNLRCRYCFVHGGEFDNTCANKITNIDMPQNVAVEGLRNILDKSPQQFCSISFFGGEPTLNMPLIKHVVNFTRQYGEKFGKKFYYSVTTNGVIPDKNLDFLLSNGFSFTISSDGIPEIQNFQRPGPKGARTAEIVAKTIIKVSKHDTPLKIRSTVCDKYVEKMSESVEYLSSLGAKVIHFEPITYAGRGLLLKENDLKKPTAEKFAKELEKAMVVAEDCNCKIVHSSFMNFLSPAYIYCDAHSNNRFVLTTDGLLSRCLEIQDMNHEFAEYGIGFPVEHKIKSFKNFSGMADFRSELKINCPSCFARFTCGGACPVRNIRDTGKASLVGKEECWLTLYLLAKVLNMILAKSENDSSLLDSDAICSIYQMQIPNSIWMKGLYSVPKKKFFSVRIG